MTRNVQVQIARCDWCISFKSRPQKVQMENIQATYPLQLVHLDYLTVEVTEGGKDDHVIIITDHFMWYTQAQVTSSQTAKCTAPSFVGLIHSPLCSTREHSIWSRLEFWKWPHYRAVNLAKYKTCILTLTIHKQMGSANPSIIHQSIGLVPYHQIKSPVASACI